VKRHAFTMGAVGAGSAALIALGCAGAQTSALGVGSLSRSSGEEPHAATVAEADQAWKAPEQDQPEVVDIAGTPRALLDVGDDGVYRNTYDDAVDHLAQAGRRATPLRTVGADPAVIPPGTSIYVPELAGLPRADGSAHDGCFVTADGGPEVVGRRLVVITGDAATTARWSAKVPANKGVHVRIADGHCSVAGAAGRRP
jgi:3D (Asp-Asp-Asp) domain-containing protein